MRVCLLNNILRALLTVVPDYSLSKEIVINQKYCLCKSILCLNIMKLEL